MGILYWKPGFKSIRIGKRKGGGREKRVSPGLYPWSDK
jgi:hypothetical protein